MRHSFSKINDLRNNGDNAKVYKALFEMKNYYLDQTEKTKNIKLCRDISKMFGYLDEIPQNEDLTNLKKESEGESSRARYQSLNKSAHTEISINYPNGVDTTLTLDELMMQVLRAIKEYIVCSKAKRNDIAIWITEICEMGAPRDHSSGAKEEADNADTCDGNNIRETSPGSTISRSPSPININSSQELKRPRVKEVSNKQPKTRDNKRPRVLSPQFVLWNLSLIHI